MNKDLLVNERKQISNTVSFWIHGNLKNGTLY